jgi:signal transduction histidine kinase
VRVASQRLAGAPPLVTPDVVSAAIAGQAPMVTTVADGRRGRAAVLGTRLNGNAFAMLVGLYSDQVESHLASLAWLLVLVWAGGLAATSALGYGLTSAALAPVVSITRRAARIAKGEFATRLDPPLVHDEVGEMTRSLNDVLERLNAALDANRRFASDASHELRGPITAMAGEIDVTLKYRRSAEEYRDALVLVRERLGGLTTLAEDLILLVRAQEGSKGIDLREVPVLPQVRDAVARLAPAACARGIHVAVSECPDLVAYADPRLLGRVFDNVLGNAVQYNRDGGTVTISGGVQLGAADEWKTDSVIITIADTGTGIPEGEWERVFERFRRLDPARARHTGGSGLGLAICREVLAVHGGSIRIVRSSPKGTTFEISLPGRVGPGGPTSVDLVPVPPPPPYVPGSASIH